MRKRRKSAMLKGSGGDLEIGLPDLCNILLTLEDLGWRPEQSRLNYLAVGVIVSEQDARNLSQAADSVFAVLSNNPEAIKRPVGIQKLCEFGTFCLKGGFQIIR
jgi:hypothetical protein